MGWRASAYVQRCSLEGYSRVKTDFTLDLVRSLTFNEATIFPIAPRYRGSSHERGPQSGLGVRSLHERGITGKGVNVAIIDQHVCLDHPGTKGKSSHIEISSCRMIRKQEACMGRCP